MRQKTCGSIIDKTNFIFIGHTRDRIQGIQWRKYSKEYAMMLLEECKSSMASVEKNFIGPALCTIFRKLLLVGVASYEMTDTPISILGSNASVTPPLHH
jgi:hypothetical protein